MNILTKLDSAECPVLGLDGRAVCHVGGNCEYTGSFPQIHCVVDGHPFEALPVLLVVEAHPVGGVVVYVLGLGGEADDVPHLGQGRGFSRQQLGQEGLSGGPDGPVEGDGGRAAHADLAGGLRDGRVSHADVIPRWLLWFYTGLLSKLFLSAVAGVRSPSNLNPTEEKVCFPNLKKEKNLFTFSSAVAHEEP